jgi:hypothetical protein
MEAVVEMYVLYLHKPAVNASDAEVAAWYREKAHVLDDLAGESHHPVEAAALRRKADAARAHADELERPTDTGTAVAA